MNEDLHKQYKRIQAAEDQMEVNNLLDLYISLYKKKFRNEPIFAPSNAHLTQIKDFKRLAKDKAYSIMNTYFQMNDDWFIKQHYSIDCLIKQINKVSTQAAKSIEIQSLKGKISLDFHCDACWKSMKLVCEPNFNFLDKPVRCDECYAKDAPIKKLTKDERRQIILKLGAAFPEVPWETRRKDALDKINDLQNEET